MLIVDSVVGWFTGLFIDKAHQKVEKVVKTALYTDERRLSNFEKIQHHLVREILCKRIGSILDDQVANSLKLDRTDVVKCLKQMKQNRWINYREHLGSSGPFELEVLISIIMDDVTQFDFFERNDMERSILPIKDFLLKQQGNMAYVSDIEAAIGQSRFITLGALSIMVRDSQVRRSIECGLPDFRFYMI